MVSRQLSNSSGLIRTAAATPFLVIITSSPLSAAGISLESFVFASWMPTSSTRSFVHGVPIRAVDRAEQAVAQRPGVLGDHLQDRLDVGGRGGHHLQDRSGGPAALQGLGNHRVLVLHLIEQSGILEGNWFMCLLFPCLSGDFSNFVNRKRGKKTKISRNMNPSAL